VRISDLSSYNHGIRHARKVEYLKTNNGFALNYFDSVFTS